MEKPREASALEACLDRIMAGESAAECLAALGSEAAAAEPLVSAAVRLQRVRAERLSDAQRQKAHVALAAAMREQNWRAAGARPARAVFSWPWGWQPSGSVALAAVLAVVLVAAMAFSAVASEPGGITYPLRVAVERAPLMFANSAGARVTGELDLAGRRLADLENYLQSTGRVEPTALAALLVAIGRAANEADMVSSQEQVALQARITDQARVLAALAAASIEPQAAAPLQAAAQVTSQIAVQLAAGANGHTQQGGPQEPSEQGPAGGPAHTPTCPATATCSPTLAPFGPTETPEPPAGTMQHQAVTLAPAASRQRAQTSEPVWHEPPRQHTPSTVGTPGPGGTAQGTPARDTGSGGTATPGGVAPTPGRLGTAHPEGTHTSDATAPRSNGPTGEPPGAQGPGPGATSAPEPPAPEPPAPGNPPGGDGGPLPDAGTPGAGGRG